MIYNIRNYNYKTHPSGGKIISENLLIAKKEKGEGRSPPKKTVLFTCYLLVKQTMSCLYSIFDHSEHIICCHENLEDWSIFGKS